MFGRATIRLGIGPHSSYKYEIFSRKAFRLNIIYQEYENPHLHYSHVGEIT